MNDDEDIPWVARDAQLTTLLEVLKETVPPIHDPCVDKLDIAVGQTCVVKASYHTNLEKSEGPYKVMYTRLDEHQYQWLDREGEQGIVTDVVFDTRYWELMDE
jgi:hypothetical protein